MYKRDLISAVSKRTGFLAKDVSEVYEAIAAEIFEQLLQGEACPLSRVGRLVREEAPSRLRWIPVEKRYRMSYPTYHIKFRVSDDLEQALSSKYADDHPDDPHLKSKADESPEA